MKSSELRKKFLDFFKNKKHTIVLSSSLLPADSSVLFTTAGMQQFKEYYLKGDSPYGKNTASVQKSFRTSDIEEVGDESHLTFFEMLGNFSFGGYFKKEAIKLAKEFLESIDIKIDYVTCFERDNEVPKDEESIKIWNKLGFSKEKGNLRLENRKENFWGPTGDEGPCGPTTEIYSDGVEIWNLVFNEYYQHKDKKLEKMKTPGVDTGMGLERLAMVSQNKKTIFETDLFLPIIEKIEEISGLKYKDNEKKFRIIADHIRASVFLISDSVLPSNIEQGYILRRLLRRVICYGNDFNMPKDFLIPLIKEITKNFKESYPSIETKEQEILSVIQNEEEKFEKTLKKGIPSTYSIVTEEDFSGEDAYNWYATSGVPFDIIKEIAKQKNVKLDKAFELDFEKGKKKHQEISRAGVEKKFGGIGKDADEKATKLHTATHLLHQALRDVLGDKVRQMGSDINSERLRFDFSYSEKMTKEQIEKVEEIVNSKIKDDLEVKKQEMKYQEAINSNALAFFKEKYPEKVNVYSIGNFSKEICAGPHVERTGQLGKFKIIKEQSSSAGVRRIKAVLE